jgi:hypothetical protein
MACLTILHNDEVLLQFLIGCLLRRTRPVPSRFAVKPRAFAHGSTNRLGVSYP